MNKFPSIITKEYLRDNPDYIFVFGDNLRRRGKGGAAKLRNELNTYGFITKKAPNNLDESFYRYSEYVPVFFEELKKLITEVLHNPDKTYLVSKLGAGLANRYNIREIIIDGLEGAFDGISNVVILD